MNTIVFMLLININLDGVWIQNYEGIFDTKQECVTASEKFSSQKYFESFECKPIIANKGE